MEKTQAELITNGDVIFISSVIGLLLLAAGVRVLMAQKKGVKRHEGNDRKRKGNKGGDSKVKGLKSHDRRKKGNEGGDRKMRGNIGGNLNGGWHFLVNVKGGDRRTKAGSVEDPLLNWWTRPPREDCPICMLPLPFKFDETEYKFCCGKTMCLGLHS